MLINSVNPYNNINFGVKYSPAMSVAIEEITDRFYKINKKLKQKSGYYNIRMNRHTELKTLPDKVINYLRLENKMKRTFNMINNSFPFRTLYIQKHPKTKQFFVTMDCFLGKKFLAPIRTKQNLNPIEHPEAIHMKFQDLLTISNKLEKMPLEELLSNHFHCLFKK